MTDSTDVISSEEPTGPSGRRPREASLAGAGARTTAMTAALTLVVAAGVATAAYRSTSNGTSPTSLIPANAFAVATADLSLPDGQDGALETMLGRFPGLHLSGDGSVRDRVLRTMIESSDDTVDYDEDIKPWLGDHVAIAGWVHDGHPQMEIVLQSTDDASARAHLKDKFLNENGDLAFRDGYAIIGSSPDAVQSALSAATTSSLQGTGPYDADIKALGHTEAITAWLDGPAAKDALSHSMLGGEGGLPFAGMGMLGAGMGEVFKGRVALGVHITDTIAQIDMRSVGATATGTAPSSMLTSLPTGTIGAVELGDPGSVVDALTPVIRIFGSFSGSSTTCFGSAPAMPMPSGVPQPSLKSLRRQMTAAIPPGTAHRRALIRRALRNYREAMRRAHQSSGVIVGSDDNCTTEPAPPTDPFAEIQKFLGISFPDDVKTVLGDRAVVAFGGLELAGLPDVAIRSHPSDLSSAQTLANTMSSTLSSSTPVDIDVSTAGDDLVLATSSAYGQEIAKSGDLGGQSAVQTALDGMPTSVNIAAYADLSRVWPLLGEHLPSGLQHLHAVGFWSATAGNVQTAQLRVVFG